MSISRVVARPLLSAMFIGGGWDTLRNPGAKVKKAEPVALPIAEKVPFLPQDAEKLVQLNGAVMLAGGTLLAIGKFRRLAALALIGSILPTTYAGHRFWEEEDEATKAQQRIHFLKNLGLLGGLILAAVDTEGAPSLTWRATHRRGRKNRSGGSGVSGAELAKHSVELAKHIGDGIVAAEEAISAAAKASGPVIEHAQASAHEAAGRLSRSSRSAIKQAQKATAEIDIARQMAALKDAQKAVAKAAGTYRSTLTKREKKAAKVDLKKQVAELKKQAALLKDAKKSVRRTVKQGKQTAKRTKGKAQPLVSTAASRASQAWSHLPVSA